MYSFNPDVSVLQYEEEVEEADDEVRPPRAVTERGKKKWKTWRQNFCFRNHCLGNVSVCVQEGEEEADEENDPDYDPKVRSPLPAHKAPPCLKSSSVLTKNLLSCSPFCWLQKGVGIPQNLL